jgi:hypothetical protein
MRLSNQAEERHLADSILERLRKIGQPARLDFANPDSVVDIETLVERAGMSLWSRDDLKRFVFLRVD